MAGIHENQSVVVQMDFTGHVKLGLTDQVATRWLPEHEVKVNRHDMIVTVEITFEDLVRLMAFNNSSNPPELKKIVTEPAKGNPFEVAG